MAISGFPTSKLANESGEQSFLSKETKQLRAWPRTNKNDDQCTLTLYIDVSTCNKTEESCEKPVDLRIRARHAIWNITAD